MQNARHVQIFHEATSCKEVCLRFALVLLLAFALTLAVVPGSQKAHAQVTSLPNTVINAVVGVDGSLQVHERRLVEFDQGKFSLAWPLEVPSDKAVLQVSGVRIASADAQGNQVADWVDLPNTHFVLQWRTQGGPAEDSFAIDSPKNTVFVFVGLGSDGEGASGDEAAQAVSEEAASGDAAGQAASKNTNSGGETEESSGEANSVSDATAAEASESESGKAEEGESNLQEADSGENAESDDSVEASEAVSGQQTDVSQYALVELTYAWENGAVAFKDVGEVYWKYVSDTWALSSQDVTMTLSLPLPQGVAAVANENVHAWGHGPSNGTFAIVEDGTISYYDSSVLAGQFAEARVVFPVGWIYGVSDEVKASTGEVNHLNSVLSQEDGWSDSDAMWHVRELNRIIVSAVACLIALLASIIAYVACGRSHVPDFTERYMRTVPAEDLHPAVAGRLWRWNHNSRSDVVSAVMRLQNAGVVEVSRAGDDDWRIERVEGEASQLQNVFDAQVMHLLFEVMAQGRSSVLVSELRHFGAHHAKDYVDATDELRWSLTDKVAELGYFDMRSKRMQRAVLVASLVVLVVGVSWSVSAGRIFPAVFAVPSALAMFALGNYLFRRTVAGTNLVARCKALHNWLLEFPSLGETLDDAQVDWRTLMPYAHQFEIADMVAYNAQGSAQEHQAAEIACFARDLKTALDVSMHDARKALSKEQSTYGGERIAKKGRAKKSVLPGVRDVNEDIDF